MTASTTLTKAQQARNLTGTQDGLDLKPLASALLIGVDATGRRYYWPKSLFATMDDAYDAMKAAGLRNGLNFTQYRAKGGFENLAEAIAAKSSTTTTTTTTEDTTMNAETVKAAIAAGIANAPAAPKAPKAKKAPAKKATPKVEAPQVDVQQALVAGLREAGVKATLALSPAGHGRVLVDGYNVAYADKQTRNGCKVTPALSTDDVPAAKRGSFKAAGRAGANYGLVALVTEANLAETVALLVQAAAKRAAAVAAKPAKPAAKKPAAKKAPARKAAAKKAPATEAAATTEA